MCIVVNKYKEQYDVYIGRGSLWGNPFTIGEDGDRGEVIQKYKKYIWDKVKAGHITYNQIVALNGMKLGCFCKPKPCHGDIIVSLVKYCAKYYRIGEEIRGLGGSSPEGIVEYQFIDEFGRIIANTDTGYSIPLT